MNQFKLLLLSLSLFLTKACYPVSHVIVGDTQPPIDYADVKVYIDYPNNYEKIAIIEASSDLAFKDISIDITHQPMECLVALSRPFRHSRGQQLDRL